MRYFLFTTFIALVILQMFGCGEESVGIRVDHVGSPVAAKIEIDKGRCEEIKTFENGGKEISASNCGGPKGRRKISVRCADEKLPAAFVDHEFPSGDSHYVAFNNVCGLSAKQIELENGTHRGLLAVWGAPLKK